MRFFWNTWLALNGWKIKGQFPYEIPKMVIAVGPHTHWIDFILGLAVRSHLQIPYAHYLGKAELFKPPFGFLFRWLGGMPVDRSKHNNLVDAVAEKLKASDRLAIAISPEGTRKKVDRLKTGFYQIAKQAGVPILMIGFDFGSRTVIIGEPFFASADEAADFKKIYQFFGACVGRVPAYDLRHLAN